MASTSTGGPTWCRRRTRRAADRGRLPAAAECPQSSCFLDGWIQRRASTCCWRAGGTSSTTYPRRSCASQVRARRATRRSLHAARRDFGRDASVRFLGFVGGADKERQLAEPQSSCCLLSTRIRDRRARSGGRGRAGGRDARACSSRRGSRQRRWGVWRSARPAPVGGDSRVRLETPALRAASPRPVRDGRRRAFGPSAVAPALEAMYRGALPRGRRPA